MALSSSAPPESEAVNPLPLAVPPFPIRQHHLLRQPSALRLVQWESFRDFFADESFQNKSAPALFARQHPLRQKPAVHCLRRQIENANGFHVIVDGKEILPAGWLVRIRRRL